MPTNIKAGNATSGGVLDIGSDGALTLVTGPAGSQVNAVSFAADGTPTFVKARSLAQIQTATLTTVFTTTAVIPADDTIPQISEGAEVVSLSFTPRNAASTLEITAFASLACTTANANSSLALFQSGATDALAGVITFNASVNQVIPVTLTHIMTAGTTSAITFSLRAGTPGGYTVTVNGSSGARYYGGVWLTRILIKEYLP